MIQLPIPDGGSPTVPYLCVSSTNEFRYTKGTPSAYRSSDHGERYFCPKCSSQIEARDDRRPDDVDILTVTLDDPNLAAPPTMHVCCERLPQWHRVEDGLMCHQGMPEL
uniref:CENP-V/GFA domain-containing protein n=1 Tax=Plectus sambesii TaxID=2011161 RepID=A0A914UT44_9BILA